MPKQWLNLQAVMPEKPDPYINPGTMKPAVPSDFEGLFSCELVAQEFNSVDKFIDIPREIQKYFKMYRPSPLIRAYALEKELKTPAKIYYKYEGNNTSGSHKLNSALPQVYYNKKEGIKALTTETGAGQWGTALAIACAFYKMPLTIFMVKGSYEQKPYRKALMNVFGSTVIASPSLTTNVGRQINKDFPGTNGSLGCAISEAVEYAVTHPKSKYVLGSVLNQVLLHQSIVGLETKEQLALYDEYPDVLIGCAGGGSNLGGIIAPFIKDKVDGTGNPHIIAVEPASCPSLTRGVYAYDFGDTGHMTPICKMYTLGSTFMPSNIHAGGLRYHGMAPIVSKLYHDKLIDEARAERQTEVFKAAVLFAKCEALIPAPESSHAIKVAIDEAIKAREEGKAKTIVFCLSGHGNLDLSAYTNYLEGGLDDYIPTEEDLSKLRQALPKV
jgi:tryptophan synthase beta chain